MGRILDWFVAPTTLDVNGGGDKPYRASCPQGDWQAPRWVSTVRVAREQQVKHWISAHYGFDGSPDGGWGSGWGNGLDY